MRLRPVYSACMRRCRARRGERLEDAGATVEGDLRFDRAERFGTARELATATGTGLACTDFFDLVFACSGNAGADLTSPDTEACGLSGRETGNAVLDWPSTATVSGFKTAASGA